MKSTRTTPEKGIEVKANCDEDWCDGPDSDELPCFECFDSTNDYDLKTSDDE